MSSYDRKYYLIREIKKAGFTLREEENERIIEVKYDKQNEARKNKYVQELRTEYQFGVQITL